jgi:hypothetical protein
MLAFEMQFAMKTLGQSCDDKRGDNREMHYQDYVLAAIEEMRWTLRKDKGECCFELHCFT